VQNDKPRHSNADCARLVDGLLPDPEALPAIAATDGGRSGVIEMLGAALWDIFSDNHQVVDADGVAYDLGSFRGSAGFIAESINRRYDEIPYAYDYMDFYMGGLGRDRDSLLPLYRWIFAQLRHRRCRWIYAFPRLHLIEPGRAEAETAFTDYDPGRSFEQELERSRRRAEIEELRRSLDEAYEKDLERARHRPLPATVASYRDVFDVLPEGWPHR
jgi:hypothetical protein